MIVTNTTALLKLGMIPFLYLFPLCLRLFMMLDKH